MKRYAIYYMPRPDSHFWRLGSSCLGYDAVAGREMISPSHKIFSDQNLAWEQTQEPRKYGFHATLKAPFSLASGKTEAELLAFARGFAQTQTSFELPRLAVSPMSQFLALTPQEKSDALHALADSCVREFEPFRAPLGEADLRCRMATPLSERHIKHLETYGYPYVFEDYHFHMTLTGALDAPSQQHWLAGLTQVFAPLQQPVLCDAIAIFKQERRDSRFSVLAYLPFAS